MSVIRLQLDDLAVEITLNRYLAITYSGSVGSVSPEDLGVSSLPVGTARGSCLGGEVSLSLHTSGFLASGSETSQLTMIVLGTNNPVNLRVTTDSTVFWINENDFVEFV